MAAQRPKPTAGMRHVALFVTEFDKTERFYVELLGMHVEWRPDNDNVYLCSGNDNLALHRAHKGAPSGPQKLDHIGFIIDEIDQVDTWYAFLKEHDVKILNLPKTHRDGARSFYCYDPDGTMVQMIYHPPISSSTK